MTLLEIPPLPAELRDLPVSRWHACPADDHVACNTQKLRYRFEQRTEKPAHKGRRKPK